MKQNPFVFKSIEVCNERGRMSVKGEMVGGEGIEPPTHSV